MNYKALILMRKNRTAFYVCYLVRIIAKKGLLENVLRRRALYRQRIIAQKCMEILKSGTHKGYTYSECMVSS